MESKRPSSRIFIGAALAIITLAGISLFILRDQRVGAPTASTRQSESQSRPDQMPRESSAPTGEGAIISFTDSGFSPRMISIKKGTMVTIRNESSMSVQFSSDEHPSHRDNTEMNLRILKPGESGTYTAATTGTWGYHDHIDDSKTGTITVTE